MPRRDRSVRAARAAVALTATILLSACATGERPSFDTNPDSSLSATTTTADDGNVPPPPALQDFLARLQLPAQGPETLVYRVKANYQGIKADVTVTRDAQRTVVAVRDVQFRDAKGQQETCLRATKACTTGWEAQRLSDLAIAPDFWGPAMYRRLTGPAPGTRIDAISTFTGTAAGQALSCISVPGPGHEDHYCTVASGAIGNLDLVDVHIDLISYRAAFDDSLWDEFPGG